MILEIDNVGILKDVIVNVSGLTVITGKNNAGKTTVGKVLYSVLRANSNIEESYEQAKKEYISSQLQKIEMLFMRFNLTSGFYLKRNRASQSNKEDVFGPIDMLFNINYQDSPLKKGITEQLEYISSLKNSVSKIDCKQYCEHFKIENGGVSFVEDVQEKHFQEVIFEAKEICNIILQSITKEDSFQLFIKDRTKEFLNYEFHNQIKPVKNTRLSSHIAFLEDEKPSLRLIIHNNSNYEFEKNSTFSFSLDRAIFIDNPFVLDSIFNEEKQFLAHSRDQKVDSIGAYGVSSHNEFLLNLLGTKLSDNFFSNLDFQTEIKPAIEKINSIIPGEFLESSDGFFYVENGSKLDVQNLATGSKMFSIIKILLMNGYLDKRTVLILDEPEAHLHPEWINRFAEIMVLLIKEVGIKVLLTTHSPNLLLALEVNSKKYGIKNNTHFYLSQKEEKGWKSRIRCIDDNINEGYSHLSIPLIEMSVKGKET